jgi:hypothetical protein
MGGKNNVVPENVPVPTGPYMRMQTIVQDYIIAYDPPVSFPQFYPAVQQKVIVDPVIARPVIQVNIPSMVTTDPVVANDAGFNHIQKRKVWIICHLLVHQFYVWIPETIPAPGIKTPMVTCFQDRIEYITMLQYMSPKSTLTDIHAGTRDIINGTMGYGDPKGHGDLYRRGLLLGPSCPGNYAVRDLTVGGIIICFWTGDQVQFTIILRAVSENGTADGIRVAYKGNPVGPPIMDITTGNI